MEELKNESKCHARLYGVSDMDFIIYSVFRAGGAIKGTLQIRICNWRWLSQFVAIDFLAHLTEPCALAGTSGFLHKMILTRHPHKNV